MKTCPSCNTPIEDHMTFCPNCGAPQDMSAAQPAEAASVPQEQPVFNAQPQYSQPQGYAPQPPYGYGYQPLQESTVSLGDWVLSMFLVTIPVVGLILLIVWAVGSETKPSKQNWARASLIWMAIGVVLSIVFASVLGAFISGIANGWFY